MSWCRWGSVCSNTIPQYKIDVECVAAECPGSSLYVYEGSMFTCCGCSLIKGDSSFECATEEEMYRHILEHDEKGHHVRRSLLHRARQGTTPELTEEWAVLIKSFGT